ncbi:restriction endonuclease subunit S [Staphylococcus caprae]|uniref:restriction endonuclease subunit S n=1 Tax=Staphylococcus caprae TaxID=29380 RepID=UPI002DB643F5|nr:restriction endonuclease subunit S [Staphylococcus caprae]MEB8095576.1 restriction endonuclease subunit S [Staphylococcus caprae]
MTEQSNTPELRFPEFEDKWESTKIKNIFKVVSGSTPLRSKTEYYNNGNIPWVKTTDLNNRLLSKTSENITELALNSNNLKLLPKQTLLIAMYGGFNQIGRTAILNMEATTNQAISALISNNNVNTKFLQSYLNFNVNKWKRYAASSRKDPNITKKDIENFIVPFTNIIEQNKIGDFFSKLDRQIELEEEKLGLLQQYKKKYTNKLLSQEIRFKNNNGYNYPNWNEEKLDNLIDEVNEKTILNNQYPLLSSTKNGLLTQEEYFKKQIGSKENKGYKILRLNQLVLSPQNLWLGNINLNQRFDIGIVSPSYRIYNLNQRFNINFAKTVLKSPRYIYAYAQASEQGASVVRRNLNLDLFYSIKVSLPCIEEQNKISAFLDGFENLIEKQYSKVDLLNHRKQGFLQKMFI